MFIVLLTYKRPLEEVDKYLDAHLAYLKEQYAEKNFLASGRKVPRTGGIILSNVATREDMEAILARDPFHMAGVADYDIIEFIPSMVGEGLEMLKK